MPENAIRLWEEALTAREKKIVDRLRTPREIQDFLDQLEYNCSDEYCCPLRVMRQRVGHCFDGALFAAAVLKRMGRPARIVDMLPNGRDDDHILTIYRLHGHWGAIAKSNFPGLRFREPVYRTLRELVMSYFENYFNSAGEKTLAGYTRPLDLAWYDRVPWTVQDQPLDQIAEHLDRLPRYRILTPKMARALSPVDRLAFESGTLGTNKAGLYQLD